ncbi:MAG: 2'-5' RNA ligase family protein [Chitinophagaceae bacterium]|nr:2'-5' RNA ligase family protein [Chitinophagaceae bacterium]
MEQQLSNMPGYRFGDYLLVLSPHEDLRERISKQKAEFSKNHGSQVTAAGRPHITLVRFRTWEMMEHKIVNRLKVIAMGHRAFKVNMKDYGSFPSHTIYINILSKLPVQELSRELRVARKLMKSPDNDPFFITEPHLTIARKLTAAQYEAAWPEYQQKQFTASFIADGMLLIKRREGEKAYQIVQRFDFMNLPVNTTQGALFSA